jgi:hypothetical protein
MTPDPNEPAASSGGWAQYDRDHDRYNPYDYETEEPEEAEHQDADGG